VAVRVDIGLATLYAQGAGDTFAIKVAWEGVGRTIRLTPEQVKAVHAAMEIWLLFHDDTQED
jgi:hypothetical protein